MNNFINLMNFTAMTKTEGTIQLLSYSLTQLSNNQINK